MNKLLLLASLLFSGSVIAGDYYNNRDSQYDLEAGVYIQTVQKDADKPASFSSKIAENPAINLFVFNPKDDSHRHLLDKNYGQITTYLVETKYNQADQAAHKNSGSAGSFQYLSGEEHVKNNTNVAPRAVSANILIETYNANTEKYTVWIANKLVGTSTVLLTYQKPAHWHLDVKNQKVRLVIPSLENNQSRLKVKSYDW